MIDSAAPVGGCRAKPAGLNGSFLVEPNAAEIQSGLELPTALKLPGGPLKGRGADLAGEISGFVSNPMNQPQASKVPLASVAAYLNDPLSYTAEPVSCPYNPAGTTRAGCLSEQAWLAGIREFGRALSGPLLDFVNQMRSTALDRRESLVLWRAGMHSEIDLLENRIDEFLDFAHA